jgi:hypothetical protein
MRAMSRATLGFSAMQTTIMFLQFTIVDLRLEIAKVEIFFLFFRFSFVFRLLIRTFVHNTKKERRIYEVFFLLLFVSGHAGLFARQWADQ